MDTSMEIPSNTPETSDESDESLANLNKDQPVETSTPRGPILSYINPTTYQDWQTLYNEAVVFSNARALPFQKFNELWLSLVQSFSVCQNPSESLLQACVAAFRTMPLPPRGYCIADDCSNPPTWPNILHFLYAKIDVGVISYEKASEALQIAERRFSCSYSRAAEYWTVVKKWEKSFIVGKSKEDRDAAMLCLYKKQFSKPFYEFDEEWEKFLMWVKQEKIAKDRTIEIQVNYYNTAEEARRLADMYTDNLNHNETYHHLSFERWINDLLKRDSPAIDTVEVLCDEQISKNPSSMCFYYINVNALNSSAFSQVPDDVNEKIFNLIQRAINYGMDSCCNQMPKFLEMMMLVASKRLSKENVTVLIDAILKRFQFYPSLAMWFASHRIVVMSAKIMIQDKKMEKDQLKLYFEKALAPVTLSFFSDNKLPKDCAGGVFLEFQVVELLKVWILAEKSLNNLSNEDILKMWNDCLGNTHNPLLLWAYTNFVRTYGTRHEVITTYEIALSRWEYMDKDTYLSRKSYLQTLSDYVDVLSIESSSVEEYDRLKNLMITMMEKITEFTRTHFETYSLDESFSRAILAGLIVAPDDTLNQTQTSISKLSDEDLETKIKTLGIEQVETDKKTGYTLYLSNVNFHANEEDIRKAFKTNGIDLVDVHIRRNAHNMNMGFATVLLKTKEEAEITMLHLERISIKGRDAFVSNQNNESNYMPSYASALLELTGLSGDLSNPYKLMSIISKYGTVKKLNIEDKEEPFTAKVEFCHASDAEFMYRSWHQGQVFPATSVVIKKCFVGSKRKRNDAFVKKEHAKAKRKETSSSSFEESPSTSHAANSQDVEMKLAKPKPAAKAKFLSFIPHQVKSGGIDEPLTKQRKTHMKHRLGLPKSSFGHVLKRSASSPSQKLDSSIDSTTSVESQTTAMREPAQYSSSPSTQSTSSRSSTSTSDESPATKKAKPDPSAKPVLLCNKDFQKLFEKNPDN